MRHDEKLPDHYALDFLKPGDLASTTTIKDGWPSSGPCDDNRASFTLDHDDFVMIVGSPQHVDFAAKIGVLEARVMSRFGFGWMTFSGLEPIKDPNKP